MKQFLFFVFKIIVVVLIIAIVLDFTYSEAFAVSPKRGKIGFIVNSEPKEYDVVILGSSRANNHFVTKMFQEKGLKAFNFGMQGSKLFESDLVLKLLLERKNKIKTVLIDVDVTLLSSKKSEATILKFYPFISSSPVIQNHLKELPDFNLMYMVPFYRYAKYDSKIGLREVFFCALNKKSKELDAGGYSALEGNAFKGVEDLTNSNPTRNLYYEEIKKICNYNNIIFIPIMTPMCENTNGLDYFDKVKKLYPEIHNYENAVLEDKYFSSCGHLNDAGARLFTARILKDFFNK